MKIWHVRASCSPHRVDGVSRTVWLLSAEQARLGHDVSLFIESSPDAAALEIAADAGMRLVQTRRALYFGRELRQILEAQRPDVVHMHSVFIPQQAVMTRVLRQCRVPHVIAPHGGLAPQVLRRGAMKKGIYGILIERPRFAGASAIAVVTPGEERAVRAYVPNFDRPIRWIPNPVAIEDLGPHRWQGLQCPPGRKRLVFLGRFDVLGKGIDVIIEIARLLPEVQFDLCGTEDPKTRDSLKRLKQNLPANVAFYDPVFGPEKGKMLAGASLYIQTSRWDAFGVAVAEAMHLGVPSAITETMELAQLYHQHNLGLVIPLDPSTAAARLAAALADETQMREWSRRGQQFAQAHFHPRVAAERYVGLYQEAIDLQLCAPAQSNSGAGRSNGAGEGYGPAAHETNGYRLGRRALVPAQVRGSVKRKISRMIELFGSHAPGTHAAPRTIVLCYHSVAKTENDLAVDPDVLREQISMLRALGYEFQNFGELADDLRRNGASRGNIACITFDDGYEDNLRQAAPLLLDLGVPATMFVTSGLMLGDPSVCEYFRKLTRYDTTFMSPRQVAELHSAGFEIGAHTHTHRNMARLTVEEMRQEAEQSRLALEEAIGGPVRTFAYPFGKRSIHYTPTTVAAVRAAGFSAAAAVAFRRVPPARSVRLFEVPRFFVTRADTSETFRQKICGHFDWLGFIQEHAPRCLKAVVSPEDSYRY